MADENQSLRRLAADHAILYQIVLFLIGVLAEGDDDIDLKILSELEDFVDRLEDDSPPDDPYIVALRQSLDGFRGILKRS